MAERHWAMFKIKAIVTEPALGAQNQGFRQTWQFIFAYRNSLNAPVGYM